MERVKVEWTGSYPALCHGQWNITVDGLPLTNLGKRDFNTAGRYDSWHFENWIEVFEDYEDGAEFEEWKLDPPNGLLESLALAGIAVDDALLEELYYAISREDWRHLSCGGCI